MKDIDTYFRTLGLTGTADLKEIKKAYLNAQRRLQKDCMCHDAGQFIRAQEQLLELNQAYEKVICGIIGGRSANAMADRKDGESTGYIPTADMSAASVAQKVTSGEERSTRKITAAKPATKFVTLFFLLGILGLSAWVAIGVLVSSRARHTVAPIQRNNVIPHPSFIPHPSSMSHPALPPRQLEQEDVKPKKAIQKVSVAKHQKKKLHKAKLESQLGKRRQSPQKTKKEVLLLESAIKGDPEAQYAAGVMYAKGAGVKKDEMESIKWLRKAAEQGNVKAQQALDTVWRSCCKGWKY